MTMIVRFILAGMVSGTFMIGSAGVVTAAGPDLDQQSETRSVAAGGSVRLPMQVPLFSERFAGLPVAVVNGEEISIGDLADAVASVHEGRKEGEAATRIGYSEILDRLIISLLFAQEAKNMGMDALPEIRSSLDDFAAGSLRQFLMREVTKGTVPDDAAVESYYRDAVRSWKLRSVLFPAEEDARAMEQQVRAGGDFASLAAEAVKAGKASGGERPDVVKPGDLLPRVREAVARLKPGQVSPVVSVASGRKAGFTVVRLEEELFPEDPKEKEQARKRALADRLRQAGMEYRDSLYKKKVKIRKKLLDSLDYEKAENDTEKLLKDKRTLATIAGGDPVTVGDLTAALKARFFHGMDIAAEGKKLNKKKQETLEQVIDKRLLRIEALRRGIDKMPAYRSAVKENEVSVLFGTFIQKAIAPGITVSEEEARAYYRDHASEYVTPEMMRLDAIAFTDLKSAEEALGKLQRGADYRWMESNADNRAPKDAKGLHQFGDMPLTVKDLPEDVRGALTGARLGEYRLASGAEGYSYVLLVRDVIPSRQVPFEEEQQMMMKKVMGRKIAEEAKGWAEKLRASSEVTVFLADADPRTTADGKGAR